MPTQAIQQHTVTRTPASVIAAELEMREWSVEFFASQANMSIDEVNAITNGAASISPDIANKLSGLLGCSTEFWLNLDSN